MVIKYTFSFTDTSKADFDVFPYTVNGPTSPTDPTAVGGVGTETTLKLYGKGMPDYGEGIEQNLIYMLENFANSDAPVFPKEGQQWYKNATTGSPPTGPELFINNSSGWDAIILATGTSPMTGELILAGNPTSALGATTKQYVDVTHGGDFTLHLTPDQNTFLDALNLPTLTGLEVNQLVGINTATTVQAQLNDRISRIGDVMDPGANLVFALAGEVLGLPNVPTVDDAAASKKYVDDAIVAAPVGDGVLTAATWNFPAVGSPFDPAQDPLQTTLTLTVTLPGSPSSQDFTLYDISRVGHNHAATDITIDTTGSLPPTYGSNVQQALENIELSKANLSGANFTGTVQFFDTAGGLDPVNSGDFATKGYVDNQLSTITRTFEQLTAPLTVGSPLAVYQAQSHSAEDNKLTITVNGIKQYVHSRGSNQINYFSGINLDITAYTGIDHSTAYDFDIAVDGGVPQLVTIIPSTSPQDMITHSDLISKINFELQGLSIPVVFGANSTFSETFVTTTSGGLSSAVISNPFGANPYLFQDDSAPDAIIGANFGNLLGSPAAPDEIIVSGDVTAVFTPGKALYISGSVTTLFGSYDGSYRVHTTGSTFDSVNTIIPVASITDDTLLVPLLSSFTGGSPAPSPSPFGDIYITPIVGLNAVATAISGIEGDYTETDLFGVDVNPGDFTNSVVFNYTIPTGALIETLLVS